MHVSFSSAFSGCRNDRPSMDKAGRGSGMDAAGMSGCGDFSPDYGGNFARTSGTDNPWARQVEKLGSEMVQA